MPIILNILGDYSEYCSDILIKKGFIAEMRGNFDEAVKCAIPALRQVKRFRTGNINAVKR